jgi:hypothetical protein
MSNSQKIEAITEILYAEDICNAEKFERIEDIVFDNEKQIDCDVFTSDK